MEEKFETNCQQWWEEIKKSEDNLVAWLQKQCYGELQAFIRIAKLAIKFKSHKLVVISQQELQHHIWIEDFLKEKYGVKGLESHEDRYWKEVKTEFDTLEEIGAVGTLAEAMRLERIRIIAKDTSFNPDLAEIFKKIEKDESQHVEIFYRMTNEESINKAKPNHIKGMEKLGLVL